jgi:hypothetical protein
MQPVSPIGFTPSGLEDRQQALAASDQLHVINSLVGGAALEPTAVRGTPPTPGFDVPALGRALEQDMRHGFYNHRFEQVMHELTAGRLTAGATTAALIEINEHVALSELGQKLSTKLAEGINNIVTKQG